MGDELTREWRGNHYTAAELVMTCEELRNSLDKAYAERDGFKTQLDAAEYRAGVLDTLRGNAVKMLEQARRELVEYRARDNAELSAMRAARGAAAEDHAELTSRLNRARAELEQLDRNVRNDLLETLGINDDGDDIAGLCERVRRRLVDAEARASDMRRDVVVALHLMTIAQAAALLQVHHGTIRRWIAAGKLRAMRVGGGWRIEREALKEVGRG